MNRVKIDTKAFEQLVENRYCDISTPALRRSIAELIENIREKGDQAVCDYTMQFDKYQLTPELMRVDLAKFDIKISADLAAAIEQSKQNIQSFHKKQLRAEWLDENPAGAKVGEVYRPVERAGVYVPGGTAPLISSVLMSVVPAQVAGVQDICVATPVDSNGNVNEGIIAACLACGITEVYCGHGPSLIAAMAFGTETVKKVDVIAGPGSAAVTEAKRQVYGYVALDLVAGPSESMIVMDASAPADLVAADILSQAEHNDSETYIVSMNATKIDEVNSEIKQLLKTRFTDENIAKAVAENLTFIDVAKLTEAAQVINQIAPEHLQIITEQNELLITMIQHAGAIFVGPYSPVPMGDFIAGPSHVLPTGGTARYMSGLSTDVFLKRIGVMEADKKSFAKMSKSLIEFGKAELLPAHAYTGTVRESKK